MVDYSPLMTQGPNPGANFLRARQVRQDELTQQQQMNLLNRRQQQSDVQYGQQNLLFQQGQQDRTAQQSKAQQAQAQREIAAARAIRYAPNAKAAAEQLYPEYVAQLRQQGIWDTLTDAAIRQHAQQEELYAQAGAGILPEAPPTQMETVQGPDGAVLQRDPISNKLTQVLGRGVQRQEVTNMTPYQAAQVDLDRQRLDFDRQKNLAAGGKGANITEGERKAAALGTRLESAMQMLAGVEKAEPGASRPTISEKAAGVLGETAANFARGSNRQQADAAQLDALDAALTLATGAAYTKEQLKNLQKSYFPQLGDKPENVKAKEQRFKLIVETARIASGRAEPSIDAAIGGQQQGQPVQIKSEAEYNALPSGTEYISPDGKTRRKR